MAKDSSPPLVTLDPAAGLWDQVFLVAPLIVVGTREPDGSYDLAPKHLAAPMSWENHFGFVCTPDHATYRNACRTECFTVSFLRPSQIVIASMTAAPRCDDGRKHALDALPTIEAESIDGRLVEHASFQLECTLDRVVDGLGRNALIVGRVVAARAEEDALRQPDRDDADVVRDAPLLAYLSPGRFASIDNSRSFPFHAGWRR